MTLSTRTTNGPWLEYPKGGAPRKSELHATCGTPCTQLVDFRPPFSPWVRRWSSPCLRPYGYHRSRTGSALSLFVLQASAMALSNDAVNKQLDNMVSFILKEGQEKAEEIKHQGEMDFTVEKMRLVNDARVKIRTEYEKKAKKAEVDKKMYASIVAREAATVEAGPCFASDPSTPRVLPAVLTLVGSLVRAASSSRLAMKRSIRSTAMREIGLRQSPKAAHTSRS